MKIISNILFAMLMFTNISMAWDGSQEFLEEANALDQTVDDLYQAQKYDEAILVKKKALEIYLKALNNHQPQEMHLGSALQVCRILKRKRIP